MESQNGETKFEPICIGDYIALYSEERQGYIFNYTSGSAQNELSIAAGQHRDFPVVPNVHSLLFQVSVQHRYKLIKKVRRIKPIAEANASDIHVQTQYTQAQKAAEAETNENRMEQERQTGKTLMYGQIIQLKHMFSGNWIHVNPIQTSITESSHMKVELRPENAKTALFRVMPRYKVKTEGELVQIGDQIVLESIKSPGQFLHTSMFALGTRRVCSDWWTNDTFSGLSRLENRASGGLMIHNGRPYLPDCLEVNLSVISSGYTICRFFKPVCSRPKISAESAALNAGTMIRFYHREIEAFLVAEGVNPDSGESVHLRVRRVNQAIPKTLYPPTSATTYWYIEKERSILDGGPVHWDDNVRIRHVIQRQYLIVLPDGQLSTGSDCEQPNNLFRLHPVVKTDESILQDSSVRIQHCSTGFWLHGYADKPYIPKVKKKDVNEQITDDDVLVCKAEKRMVGTVKEVMYDDAFSIQTVCEENLQEVNTVAGSVSFMNKLAWELSRGHGFSPRIVNQIEMALGELRDFMFIDKDTTCKRRQKLLRNFQIVDMAVELLKFRTDPKFFGLESLFLALINLLSAYLNGDSRKNELYMGRHLGLFLNQIGDTSGQMGITTTIMTVELLKNNRKLVDRISFENIDKICNLIKKQMSHRYLTLLSALCLCDGAALSRNQDYILDNLLLEQTGQVKDNIFLQIEAGQDIARRNNVVYISWDGRKSWQTLHDFCAQNNGTDYFEFLKCQLWLMADLCAGRNASAVELLTETYRVVTWEECYICLTDSKLNDEIRAIFCRLLYDLFINVGTNFVCQDTKLVYIYSDICLPRNRKNVTSINSNGYKPIPLPFVDPLKLWINEFLEQNDSMVASEIGRNTLISEVLTLVRQLTLLGYYEEFKEVKAVLDPILGLLEGSDDLPYRVEDLEAAPPNVQRLVESYRSSGRFKKTTQNAAMVSVKISACHAAELLFNLRASVRLDRLLSEFKQVYKDEHSGRRHPLGPILYRDYNRNDELTNTKALNTLEQLFKETDYVGNEFVAVALDLSKYEYEELVAEAMFLLHRYHSSYRDLFENATKTQLLLTERSREAEEFITGHLRQLRLMLTDRNIDPENARRLKNILHEFSLLCYLEGDKNNECHAINQQMLYNHGLVGDVFDIITGEIETEHETLTEVYQSCFELLKAMARGNPTVQGRLFNRLADFLKIDEAQDYLAELFVEIFAGNRELCLQIPPSLVTEIVAMLAKTHSPGLIRLLISLVMIGNVPLKRNQGLVIKGLLQYKQSIDVLTEPSTQVRLELLKTSEKKRGAKDKKCYVANIVQLLAYCSHGDNKTVESICQSMFTLSELLEVILLPQLCDGLRAPFVQFLISVFFTSNLESATFELRDMAHEPKLWTYFDSLCYKFQRLTHDIIHDPEQVSGLLKRRPARIHCGDEDREHELQETLHYLFDAVFPFLHLFYKQFYNQDTLNDSIAESEETSSELQTQVEAQSQISAQLLHAALLPFCRHIHKCLTSVEQLHTLNQTVKTVVNAVSPDVRLPAELILPLKTTSDDPLTRYHVYFEGEERLNLMLCTTVDNLSAAFGGRNLVSDQLGVPIQKPYTDLDAEDALPLGAEYQSLVSAFVTEDEDNPEKRLEHARAIIGQIRDSVLGTRSNERDKMRLSALTVRNLQVLRTIIHNEIVKIPDENMGKKKHVDVQRERIEQTQRMLTEMGLLEAVLPHISSFSQDVSREVLALLAALLHSGSKVVQDKFMVYFLSSREEPFFACIKARMQLTEEAFRERRNILNQYKDAKQKLKRVQKGKTMTQQQLLQMMLKDADNTPHPEPVLFVEPEEKLSFGQKFLKFFGLRPTVDKKVSISDYRKMRQSMKASSLKSRHDITFKKNKELQPDGFTKTGAAAEMSLVKETTFCALTDKIEETEANKAFKDTGNLKLVLKVLAGLCDGQNTDLQEYLREQWDNLKVVDTVGDTADFLAVVYSSINHACIDLVIQMFDTLIEMVQGNEANQIDVFDRKVIDYVNYILRSDDFPGCTSLQVYNLKRSIGILLTDMVEQNSASGHTRMIMESVNKEELSQVMRDAFVALNSNRRFSREMEDLVMNVGFLYHHLLCRAFDLDPTIQKEKFTESDVFVYFNDHTMSVELLAQEDTLQRVYFTVEDKEVLRKAVKERLKWEIDRSSPSNKHRDFLAWAREVTQDIRYQRKVQSYPLGRFLVKNWALLNTAVLLLSIVLNGLVLFGWMAPEKFNPDYKFSVADGNFRPLMSHKVRLMTITLGIVHVVLCSMLLLSFLLANRPTLPGWCMYLHVRLKRLFSQKKDKQRRTEMAPRTKYLSMDLLSTTAMYYFVLFLLSVLGTTVSAAFFSFHLLHIANQNQLLRRVILAVTLNGRSMLLVCFLGLVFFYIYALLAFLFLRNIFYGNNLYCQTMFECMIATIHNGLMYGMADNFSIKESDENYNFEYFAWKAIYDISFFAVITTIGLNIVLGITIDTFSQLREGKLQIEEDMNSVCFICNRQSFEFEHHGRGFDHHVKEEHNMWAYLFFFIHLADTTPNDLTSLELYVFNKIEEDSGDFFPMGRALTLSQWEDENADMRLQKVVDQMDVIIAKIREQDQEKERMQQQQQREVKKKQHTEARKSLFGKRLSRRKEAAAINQFAHATYGPYRFYL